LRQARDAPDHEPVPPIFVNAKVPRIGLAVAFGFFRRLLRAAAALGSRAERDDTNQTVVEIAPSLCAISLNPFLTAPYDRAIIASQQLILRCTIL